MEHSSLSVQNSAATRDFGDRPALIAICGTPSPLTRWVAHSAHRMASAAWGAHVFSGANTEEQFLDALGESTGGPFILLTDVPTRALMDRIVGTFDKILLVEDDPVDVIGFVHAERSVEVWQSVTIASQSLTTLNYLREKLSLPELRRNFYSLELGVAERAIGGYLGIEAVEALPGRPAGGIGITAEATVLSAILAEISHAKTPGGYFPEVGPIERDVIAAACRHLENIVRGSSYTRAEWPISLFLTCDKKGQPQWQHYSDPIDLTGPARTLLYGPYLHLPVGRWILNGSLSVIGNDSRNVIQIDINSGELGLAKVKAPLPAEGDFSFEIDFAVDEPREPMQLRIHILEGAIEGTLFLSSVKMSRVK